MAAVQRSSNSDAGSALIETMAGLALLAIVMAGLMSMDAVATSITENQGHLSARNTEYAQDKMEQLLSLAYGDSVSDTTVFPALPSGGTGLDIGGNTNPATPSAGYVDYLDQNGQLLASSGTSAPTGWFYKRVWRVTQPQSKLKQITVTVTVARGFGNAAAPISTVSALKSFPF